MPKKKKKRYKGKFNLLKIVKTMLPCPFCGHGAGIVAYPDGGYGIYHEPPVHCFIEHEVGPTCFRPDILRDEWNLRADSKERGE